MLSEEAEAEAAALFVDVEDGDFGKHDAAEDVSEEEEAYPSPHPRAAVPAPSRKELVRQSAVPFALESRGDLQTEAAAAAVTVDDFMSRWRGHRKHFFCFTLAGRPVFSYHCAEEAISELIGFMYGILAFAQRASDQLLSITAGPQEFAFSQLGNLWYVATSRCGESTHTLQRQLHTLHQLVLTTLTGSIAQQIARNPRLDLRHLLGDSANIMRYCIRNCAADPSTDVTAALCVPLPRAVRDAVGHAMQSLRTPGSVFGIVLAGRRLVQLVRCKGGPMHPLDLLLCATVIAGGAARQAAADTWLPICLPSYEAAGYVFAYVHFVGEGQDDRPSPPATRGASPSRVGSHEMVERLTLCVVSRSQTEFTDLLSKRHETLATFDNTIIPDEGVDLGLSHRPIANLATARLRENSFEDQMSRKAKRVGVWPAAEAFPSPSTESAEPRSLTSSLSRADVPSARGPPVGMGPNDTAVQLASHRRGAPPPATPSGITLTSYLRAACMYSYSTPDVGVPQLRHFVYKQKCMCTMPLYPAPYHTRAGKRSLTRLYAKYRSVCRDIGSVAGDERCLFAARDTECIYIIQSPGVEVAICLSAASTRATAVAAAEGVHGWVAKHASDLFVSGACW